jgi:hypothetical protein
MYTNHQNVTSVKMSAHWWENVALLTVGVFYPYILLIVTAAMLKD